MTYLCYNLPQTISERYFSAFNFKFTVCLEYKIQCKFFLLISFFSKFLIYDVLFFSIHYSVRFYTEAEFDLFSTYIIFRNDALLRYMCRVYITQVNIIKNIYLPYSDQLTKTVLY